MGSLFGDFHRLSHCGCIPGRGDLTIGTTSLVAKYNGIRNKGHVQSKLVDLITHTEMVYACGITAAVKGFKTPSGIYAVLVARALGISCKGNRREAEPFLENGGLLVK